MAAPLTKLDAFEARSRKGRVLTALALTGVATFVVLALCSAKREVEYRAAVVLMADRTGAQRGRPEVLSEEEALRSARDAFAEAGGRTADLELGVVLLTESGANQPAFRIEARSSQLDGFVAGLNACGRSLAGRWNEFELDVSAKNVANGREVVREARRRRDALDVKVQELNGEQPAQVGDGATLSGSVQEAARDSVGEDSPFEAANEMVRQLREELDRRRQRFTDEHPEVRHGALELAEAEARLAAISPTRPTDVRDIEVQAAPDDHAALDGAISELAAADGRLAAALAAEASAVRRHTELLANPPWRCEAASEAIQAFTGAARAPWGSVAG